MPFTTDIVIPDWALADFKNFATLLKNKYSVPDVLINRIYLHWSVAPHGMEFPDYNSMALLINNKLYLHVTGNPQDNAPGLNNNQIHSHTWHRNTGALGISIDGMDGATVNNFGPDAPSEMEILYLCGGAAAMCKVYNIDSLGKVKNGTTHLDNNGNTVDTKGEWNILTHAECAIIDAYPSERWDLGVLSPLPDGVALTAEMRSQSGDILRNAIHRIKEML